MSRFTNTTIQTGGRDLPPTRLLKGEKVRYLIPISQVPQLSVEI